PAGGRACERRAPDVGRERAECAAEVVEDAELEQLSRSGREVLDAHRCDPRRELPRARRSRHHGAWRSFRASLVHCSRYLSISSGSHQWYLILRKSSPWSLV